MQQGTLVLLAELYFICRGTRGGIRCARREEGSWYPERQRRDKATHRLLKKKDQIIPTLKILMDIRLFVAVISSDTCIRYFRFVSYAGVFIPVRQSGAKGC